MFFRHRLVPTIQRPPHHQQRMRRFWRPSLFHLSGLSYSIYAGFYFSEILSSGFQLLQQVSINSNNILKANRWVIGTRFAYMKILIQTQKSKIVCHLYSRTYLCEKKNLTCTEQCLMIIWKNPMFQLKLILTLILFLLNMSLTLSLSALTSSSSLSMISVFVWGTVISCWWQGNASLTSPPVCLMSSILNSMEMITKSKRHCKVQIIEILKYRY